MAFAVIDTFYSHKSLLKFDKELKSHSDSSDLKLSRSLSEIATLKQIDSNKDTLIAYKDQQLVIKNKEVAKLTQIVSNDTWQFLGLKIKGVVKFVVIVPIAFVAGVEAEKIGLVKF